MDMRSWHDRGFELEEEPRFHHASWHGQRIAWSILALVLFAALLGVLGNGGPFAKTEVTGGPVGVVVEHERFPHYTAPSILRVRLPADAARNGEIRLRADRRYIEGARVESITPRPERMEAGSDELVYVFASGTSRPTEVVFRLNMDTVGLVSGAFALDTRAPVRFTQFVFP
jgi:protein-L-isoaspartate(D-aspartate) O-methyltransferase